MIVKQIMSSHVQSCTSVQTCDKAAQIMWDENHGSVPIVNDNDSNILCGIITDRDICMGAWSQDKRLQEIPIKDVMVADVITCHQDNSVTDATYLMQKHHLHRIPVIDDGNQICGIISLTDLATITNDTAHKNDIDYDAIPNVVGNVYASIVHR